MNIFSILYLFLMVAIIIEASKEGDALIDINESEKEGRICLFCYRYTDMLYVQSKEKFSDF